MKKREDFKFCYHFIPRTVKRPDCHKSIYFNRFPKKDGTQWTQAMTPDDPWIQELAVELEKKIGNKSDKYKAGYILKLVQYGYKYQSDTKTFGEERWAFPVCTAYLHAGDCEDGALLGASLSYLLGLDVIMIHKEGHALYGVNVRGFGMRYKFEDTSYLICETTGIYPIGISMHDRAYIKGYKFWKMDADYIEKHTYVGSFDNLRL